MLEPRHRYDEALQALQADVVTLAARTCEQIGAATRALLDEDLGLVDAVYAEHEELLALGRDIEHRAYQLFALQQPLAADLRILLAVLRILHELELTAGLMRNVARGARRLYPRQLPPRMRGIFDRMGQQATRQMRLAVDAFAARDVATAKALPDIDDTMDDLQKDLFRAIFAQGATDESDLQQAVQTAFLGRDYERAADHAVTIGRWIEFMVTGALPGEQEPAPDGDAD